MFSLYCNVGSNDFPKYFASISSLFIHGLTGNQVILEKGMLSS